MFESPMPDADYRVNFHPEQIGTYDVWPTLRTASGFRVNISPAADADVTFAYFVAETSDDALGSLRALVTALAPIAWFRQGLGITSAGGSVSQWDDQSGNGNHLIQATATNQPALQGDGSILFDGVDNYMKCVPFTLVQPETVYVLGRHVTFFNQAHWLDGEGNNSMAIWNEGNEPDINAYAGNRIAFNSNLPTNTYGVVAVVFNGASSVLQVNTVIMTGDCGIDNGSGLTVGGAGFFGGNPANVQIKEILVFPDAHDESTRNSVINYLSEVGGV